MALRSFIPTLFVLISQNSGLLVITSPSSQRGSFNFILLFGKLVARPPDFALAWVPVAILLLLVLVREKETGLGHAPLRQLLHRVLVDVGDRKPLRPSHVVLFLLQLALFHSSCCVVEKVRLA